MSTNITTTQTNENAPIKAFRKASDRHVLVIETKTSEHNKKRIKHDSELLRKVGNELTTIMQNNYTQLTRTHKYQKLRTLYATATNKNDNTTRKKIGNQMKQMQKEYNLTWDYCRKTMITISKKYNLGSIITLTKAENIWTSVKKCLYSNGKHLHFQKYGEYPTLRAKQINRGIIIITDGKKLQVKYNNMILDLKPTDRFQTDEIEAIINYLLHAEEIDKQAINTLLTNGECISTYRPCYVTLVPQVIRNDFRVFAHITIEGKAKPKYDKNGNLRHSYGNGIIGCDIGTQTIAYTSDTEVGLKNLAERGSSITKRERQERKILRAMDRSRRAMNPEYYNEDGTIKKGKKHWKKSNNYKKLQRKHAELCRINAINRKLAINEDVNHLRSLGDEFVTEPKNASKLARRAKPIGVVRADGSVVMVRRKRFGRSVQNRCPGYFQAQVMKVFKCTGGSYFEVPFSFRASQYDHTLDDYVKKKLSVRVFCLGDGTLVQRDWYSSFLLYCYDYATGLIDKARCKARFGDLFLLEERMIRKIRRSGTRVMNSGL